MKGLFKKILDAIFPPPLDDLPRAVRTKRLLENETKRPPLEDTILQQASCGGGHNQDAYAEFKRRHAMALCSVPPCSPTYLGLYRGPRGQA